MIGDGGVGKTSLIKKYTQGTFETDYVKTIGAQFSRYDKEINSDIVKLIFWDIAGQDDFNFLHPLFFQESKACIIVFSLEENDLGKDSFTHIQNWYDELIKYCGEIPVVYALWLPDDKIKLWKKGAKPYCCRECYDKKINDELYMQWIG